MRAKTHQSLNPKLLLLGVLLAFILIFLLKSNLSSVTTTKEKNTTPSSSLTRPKTLINKSNDFESPAQQINDKCPQKCNKIPPSIAKTLIHYATSTITPQQTLKEISVAAEVLEKRSPCNFLVFGLGHDSLMWATLNQGGHTLFLEEDAAWIKQVRLNFPALESRHVEYRTRVSQAGTLMELGQGPDCMAIGGPMQYSLCPLALKELPIEVFETQWDVIMVDAPTGFYEDAPGRMAAIYTAGMMARNRRSGAETDVFVHDVNRAVEDTFSKVFLCEAYMVQQQGRLRHFNIPTHNVGHASSNNRPFCPTLD